MFLTEQEARELVKKSEYKHYVYGLCYPNGTPFYIGKGSGDRFTHHVKHAKNFNRTPYNPFKIRVIQKILNDNKEIKYKIFGLYKNTLEAEKREEELINYYGRRNKGNGPLTNLTSGKDGHTQWSRHSRKTISQVMKDLHKRNPELRIRNGEAVKLAVENDPSIRERMSEAAKERFSDPEERAKQSRRIKNTFKKDPTLKKRQVKTLKRRLEDDSGLIEKYRENSIQIYINRPEVKKKISKSLKTLYKNNPEIQRQKGEKRRENNIMKRVVRERCLKIIDENKLNIKPPNGYQGLETFQKFEKHLLTLIQNSQVRGN